MNVSHAATGTIKRPPAGMIGQYRYYSVPYFHNYSGFSIKIIMFASILSAAKLLIPTSRSLGEKISDAVVNNDLVFIKNFLANGGDPNGSIDDLVRGGRIIKGRPFVIVCANCNNREAVALFLDAGAMPDTFDPNDGKSLVHHAADWNDVGIMARLLKCGANPEGSEEHSATPLYIAAVRNHIDVAKQLLDAGAKPNVTNWAGVKPIESLGVFEGGQTCGTPNLRDKKSA